LFCIITQKDSIIFILKYCPCMMNVCQIFICCQSFNVCIFTTFENPTVQEVAFEHICLSPRSLRQLCEKEIFCQKWTCVLKLFLQHSTCPSISTNNIRRTHKCWKNPFTFYNLSMNISYMYSKSWIGNTCSNWHIFKYVLH
jgi:hypothetical protein